MSTTKSMEERVAKRLSAVLGTAPEALLADPEREIVDEFDSLTSVKVLIELEKEFGTKVPAERIGDLTSVRAIADLFAGLSPRR